MSAQFIFFVGFFLGELAELIGTEIAQAAFGTGVFRVETKEVAVLCRLFYLNAGFDA